MNEITKIVIDAKVKVAEEELKRIKQKVSAVCEETDQLIKLLNKVQDSIQCR
jgi:hypothetical protein